CFNKLPTKRELESRKGAALKVVLDDVVKIGEAGDLSAAEAEVLQRVIELLVPWRKGPYELFGQSIDSEWRSNKKWDRVVESGVSLESKIVADIGCSSGYYMFRALAKQPRMILGFDPSEKFYFAFQLFQRYLDSSVVQYELLGVEHMPFFDRLFETVLCMGILYHHRDPLGLLAGIRGSMIEGGEILIETQAIPGDQPICLCPPDRYAKARNVYFVPTASCVVSWLRKSRFQDIEVVSVAEINSEEQRKTALAPFESLSDFLSDEDPSKTVEGFDAPLRVMIKARV
ncbi:UNVERIFIED_CONTAM: hypothetical protein GTU68_027375, partial [Idotea baltica]|nr:hypothetical protein [Idotea baltica]